MMTTLDIVVSTEDDAEVRRVTIGNVSRAETHRAHVVRGNRAGNASLRYRAPRVLEDVRADRIRCAIGRDSATRGRRAPTISGNAFAIAEGRALSLRSSRNDGAFLSRSHTRCPAALIDEGRCRATGAC